MANRFFLSALLFLALAGCAQTRFANAPLPEGGANVERRTLDVVHKDRPVILLAISGGGSRAADLGWQVLRELKGFSYVSDGRPRRLIDDVAMVSSVSGGSAIAGWFGLYGPEGLDGFEPAFLLPDNTEPFLNPFTWLGLAVDGAARIDLEEEMFDQRLFGGKTLAELNQPGKPFVIFNATDMGSGEVFAFTPSRFDDICSDFDATRISAGVAASAAVPILLSPVALRNYAPLFCKDRPVPSWIAQKLGSPYELYANLEGFKRARYANALRHGPDAYRDIQYIYLLDGGLSDNLGIRSLQQAITSPQDPSGILRAINDGLIKRLVVVVVNARAEHAGDVYAKPQAPGVIDMVKSVASAPIDAATANGHSNLEKLLEQIRQAGYVAPRDARFGDLRVYGVTVDFDQLRGTDPYQRALQAKVKAVPTSWTITPDNRRAVEEAGSLLLRQHPCFQRLLLDLNVPAPFADPEFAKTGCGP